MQGPQLSMKVLAVVGRLCVSRTFRDDFFANPRDVALRFAGPLEDWELLQIDDLGGHSQPPAPGFTKDGAKARFDGVYTFYLCPERPCPRGD